MAKKMKDLRKKNRRQKFSYQSITGASNYNFDVKIVLKSHFIERLLQRRPELKKLSIFEVRPMIEKEIKRAKILGIEGKEEHLQFNGHIYVCKRENGTLTAVTYLCSGEKKYHYIKAV